MIHRPVKDTSSLVGKRQGVRGLAGGGRSISSFVTLKVQHRKARMGRNPQTEESIKIPAKKVVKAVPAGVLKGILGGKKK